MGLTNWLLLFIALLLIQIMRDLIEQHKELMRLLSDLATMLGDGIDAVIEKG